MGDIQANIRSVKLGTSDVKLYLGDILVYPKVIAQITATSQRPTQQTISSVAASGPKPSGVQVLVTGNITRPTLQYIAYPVSWETIQNGQIIRPVIYDSNGFEVGFEIDEDDPTMTSNGITYRLLNIELGVDTYTIEF